MNTLMGSGAEVLSGAWNTTKEVSQQYYDDQVQPLVTAAQSGVKQTAEDLKTQYNQGVEQINEAIQGQVDQAKNQVNKLKVE